jgi:phosphohistidine swiveling domain-containing protein
MSAGDAMTGAGSVHLARLGSCDFTEDAGGRKAAPLHQLMLAGFPVPAAFVVSSGAPLDAGTQRQIDSAVTAIGGYPVAARSSGHLEDLAGASFAGQYVSVLEIQDLSTLVQAITRCRESSNSPQVRSYLQRNRLDPSQARVSVLVQAMVDAAVAGVAFSVHPMTGREEHALVECCLGLGEKLVSGQTSPTRYVLRLDDASVIERESGAENVELSPALLAELNRCILELQAHFGRPQDIEWAVDRRGTLWILQSRPITCIQWRSDIEEFTSADFREGGVSARVCTPLMYSVYRAAMQQSMQQYLVDIRLLSRRAPQQEWIGVFYGRPYWSASAVKRTLMKVPGFDEATFDADLGIQKKYGESGPASTPTTVGTIARVIPVAIALERRYRQCLKWTADYGRRFLPQEARHLAAARSFATADDAAFLAMLRDAVTFQLTTERDYFTTIYNNANCQSDLKKLLASLARATGQVISAVDLMSGLQDVSHMKMQRDLVQLVKVATAEGTVSPVWDQALADFLARNYFHADVELDISTPRWGERPERVRQIVEDILRAGTDSRDPDQAARAQFDQFSAAEQGIDAAIRRSLWHRVRFGRFRSSIRRARTFLSRREEMREYSTRAYNLLRLFVLEAGRRLQRKGCLEDADDVFMLHTDELVAFAGPGDHRDRALALARFRRLMYRGYRGLEPPGELGRHVTPRTASDHLDSSSEQVVLRGIGCSAGVVSAKVRVLRALEDARSLRPAEILVTRFTDPGWTPVLGQVTGVVTEVGGLLSHAAVIGREYGIPAVLNVQGATEILKTGQRVQIDGTAGTVTVLDANA